MAYGSEKSKEIPPAIQTLGGEAVRLPGRIAVQPLQG